MLKLQTINLTDSTLKKAKAIAVIFNEGVSKDQLNSDIQAIDQFTNGKLSELIDSNYFKSSLNPLSMPIALSKNQVSHLFVLELTKKANNRLSKHLGMNQFIKQLNSLVSQVVESQVSEVLLSYEGLKVSKLTNSQIYEQINLAFARASYQFNHHKSEKNKKKLTGLSIIDSSSQVNNQLSEMNALIEGINLSKDLGNEPSNVCTPSFFAQKARQLAKQNGLKINVLNEGQMQKLGMNSFLAVSKGSIEEPKMIFLEYEGATKNEKPIALVGKGICFDTGGISIKPSNAMDEMKYDMCGAASVIGVMKAISLAGLKVNVVGVMAMAENMPSDGATKPGDIVKAYNGTTIEILNTDAEGRLVLADALSYTIEKYQPSKTIDIATLTGAIVISLAGVYSGTFSNDNELSDELVQAGENSLDLTWQMPMHPAYQDMLKSNFADLPNISDGRGAGSITAAHFLEKFTKGTRWAHLDIAGVAWESGAKKGATGRPVNLLYHFIKQNQVDLIPD